MASRSRWLVGSSRMSASHSRASSAASATRFFCPPDSWSVGTSSSAAHAQARQHRFALPLVTIEAVAHRGAHGARRQHRELGQRADPSVAAAAHDARLGFAVAAHHREQRALAAAVETDDADAVAVVEGEREIGEQRADSGGAPPGLAHRSGSRLRLRPRVGTRSCRLLSGFCGECQSFNGILAANLARGSVRCCMRDGHAEASNLVDRVNERGVLDQLVAGVRGGRSHVLVLRGEAGVGKTALLRHLPTAAGGCRVAWATGVESEMELAFAGLHALCAPLLGRLDALPGPAARRAEHGVRPERRTATGSLPRRAGGAEPAGRRRPRSSRSCASSTTRSGSTRCPRRRSRSWRAGSWRSGWRSCSRCATSANEHVFEGLPELVIEGLGRRRRPPAARRDDPRPARRAGEDPDPRRDARQPPRADGAAARTDAGRARGRVRITRRAPADEPHRAQLPPARQALPRDTQLPPPDGGGRAARRCEPAVARRRTSRDRHRGRAARPRPPD